MATEIIGLDTFWLNLTLFSELETNKKYNIQTLSTNSVLYSFRILEPEINEDGNILKQYASFSFKQGSDYIYVRPYGLLSPNNKVSFVLNEIG